MPPTSTPAVTGAASTGPAPAPLPTKLNLSLYKDGPIQRFTDAGLQAQITKLTAMLPPDKHFGVMGVANLQGAALVSVGRIGNELTITMAVEKEWRKPGVKAEAAIVYTPF